MWYPGRHVALAKSMVKVLALNKRAAPLMQYFEVKQEQEGLWSVSRSGRCLNCYSTEEEARWAALLLASESCQSGIQATVTITPPELSASAQDYCEVQRFTGM
jgi:hypothetical protein